MVINSAACAEERATHLEIGSMENVVLLFSMNSSITLYYIDAHSEGEGE